MVIEAITSHSSRLTHCWLIGTSTTDLTRPASQLFIPALVEYLRRERHLQCEFHVGPAYDVPLDDDALVFNKTLDLLRRIFDETHGAGISPSELIADFTSGIRSMTLGMILACLDGERDIEMVGTHYDSQGNWIGQTFPIVFSFEPVLQKP